MDIVVKGRKTGVNERFRDYLEGRVAKLEKLDPKLIRLDVEVTKERNPRMSDQRERVELTIHSRGPVIKAEAAAENRFSALDAALDKLDARVRKMCNRRKDRRHGKGAGHVHVTQEPVAWRNLEGDLAPGDAAAATLGGARASVAVEDEPDREAEVPIPMEGEAPLVVREKAHTARPMTIDQALHEMELVGHDFYLFRDSANGRASVVYRRRGYDYGVIRLVEQ